MSTTKTMKRILSGIAPLALCTICTTQSQAAVGDTIFEDTLRYTVLTEDVATQTGTVLVSARSESISGNVTIPESITSSGWTYVVTTIPEDAFYKCTSLTGITIPGSVTSIGDWVFWGCSSLTSIEVEAGNMDYSSLEGVLFDKDQSILIQCPEGKKEYVIPDSVTSIEDSAFYDCRSLTGITISDSVTSIGDWVFWGCSSLTSITIPESVIAIGEDVFVQCSNLTSIKIEAGNKNYSSLEGVLFNEDQSILIRYPEGKNAEEYVIPDSVTSIRKYAFEDCTSLTRITIPDSVTSIPTSAFYDCNSLMSIEVEAGNMDYSSLEGVLFNKDQSLLIQCPGGKKEYIIPSSVTSIGEDAFANCMSLTSLTIPDSVTSISEYAFYGCDSLTSIEVEAGNMDYSSVDGVLFDKAQSLLIQCPGGKKEYVIPDGVTSIGDSAFEDCMSLTSLTIPDSVTSIGYYAFASCSSLMSITIPDGVTSIGEDAFASCSSLTSITIPASVTSIEERAFEDCSSLTSITIPDGVSSIGDRTFRKCSSLTSIYFKGDAPSVEWSVFYGCGALKTVYYVEGKKGWTDPWEGIPTAMWVPEPVRPTIGFSKPIIQEDGSITFVITFEGTLQWSENLKDWQSVTDASAGKYQVNTRESQSRFYRTVQN